MSNQPDLKQIAIEFGPMVSSICSRMIFDPHIAEEAAQETWLEVSRSLPSFRGESKLSTWIYTITRRVIIRYTTKEKTYSTKYLSDYFRSDEPGPPLPEEPQDRYYRIKELCNQCMMGILHCLDNDSRLAYIMRDIAGLSYKEVGQIFGKPEPGLRKIISRARSKLRRFLNQECFLFNPQGNCKCRMKAAVKDINLEKEFSNLRKTVQKMRFFYREAEDVLPQKNFWKKIA